MKKLSALLVLILILSKYSLALNVSISIVALATCNNPTGIMSASPIGGTYPYTISWSNGANTWEVTGLTGGTTLTATVTDANGSTGSATATMQSQPYLNFIGISMAGTLPCEGFCNGQGHTPIEDLNGVPPYFATYDGALMQEVNWFGGAMSFEADNICWNSPGNVYIEDANGCSVSSTWPPYYFDEPQITGLNITDACTTAQGSVSILSNYPVYSGYLVLYEILDENNNVVWSANNNSLPVQLNAGNYTAQMTSFTGHFDGFYFWNQIPCTTVSQAFTIQGCGVPSGLNTTNLSGTFAKLNWSTNDCAVGYKIKYRPVGTTAWTNKNVNSNIGYKNIGNLTPNTQYQWRVRTKCSTNPIVFSQWSGNSFFTTPLRSGEFEEEEITFNIYPNPTTDQLNIATDHFEISKLQIVNTLGQVVLSQNLTTQYSLLTTQINVSTLPAGVYLLTAFINQQQVTKMFVKE